MAEHPGVCRSGALALGTHRLRAEQATASDTPAPPQTRVTCHHGLETAQIRGTRDRWAGAGKAMATLNWQNSRAGRAPHVRVRFRSRALWFSLPDEESSPPGHQPTGRNILGCDDAGRVLPALLGGGQGC